MITAEFFSSQGKITGFSISGHSGYAAAGKDIICAAVTSAVRFTELLINDKFNAGAKVNINNRSAEISLTLPKKCDNESALSVLSALQSYISELREEYPEYIKVLTQK